MKTVKTYLLKMASKFVVIELEGTFGLICRSDNYMQVFLN